MGVEREWQATERQAKFLSAMDVDEVFYGGAAGGGKSDALLVFSIVRRMEYPTTKGLVLRRTYPELERSLVLRSLDLLSGLGARYDAQRHWWRFPDGGLMEFGYCERDEDVYRYQSAEYADIAFDEVTQFSEFQYTYLLSRARTTIPGCRPLIRAAGNPGGVGHAWVRRRFVDVAPPETVYTDPITGRRRLFIPARVCDNPYLMTADPGYLKRLEELPEHFRRALRDGDWDIFAGQYFPEWSRDSHVCEPFTIPEGWYRFRAFDWGHAKPYCCLWLAVDYDGTLWVYRELYGWNGQPDTGAREPPSVVASKIREAEAGENVAVGYADPSIWAQHDEPQSIADKFHEAGVHWAPAANDRINGWMQVHERLKVGSDGPRLRVFATCGNLIRTLPMMIHDPHNPEDLLKQGMEDHGVDALRYACMAYPIVPARPQEPEPDDWAHKAARDIERLASRRDGSYDPDLGEEW